MKVSDEIAYQASPSAVFGMLADEGFQRHKCAATGALSSEVSVVPNGDRTVISTTRVMPTSSFPDFVRNLVGSTMRLVETDDWGAAAADGSRSGTLTVVVGGAPIGVTGTLMLMPAGAGSLEQIVCDLTARVPFIGRRIESAAAPAIQAGIDVERREGQAWLRSRP